MKETILAIAGKPGLYKLVSRGKNNLIVEALDATHRRQPAFGTDRITSLGDVAMYSETDDVPLMTILESMKKLEDGKKASIDAKKATADELHDYLSRNLFSGTTSSLRPALPTSLTLRRKRRRKRQRKKSNSNILLRCNNTQKDGICR